MIKKLIQKWFFTNTAELSKAVEMELNTIRKYALDRTDGVSTTFLTQDGKTVTVVNGQITKVI